MNPKHEIWITSEKRTKKNPTGSQFDPYPVTTRDGFDGIMNKAIARRQELHLHPGDYRTRGSWAINQTGPLMLYGHGRTIHRPTITLFVEPEEMPEAIYDGTRIRRPDVSIISTNPLGEASNVENVVLYANVSEDILVTGGINCEGPLIARNVHVGSIRGMWARHPKTGLSYEAFGIRSFGTQGGSHVENCTVYMRPDSYGNGITIGHVPNYAGTTQPDPSSVVGCYVSGSSLGHCGYTISSNTRVVDCAASNVIHCIYQDTGGAQNCTVENFLGRCHWAFLRLHSHNPNEHFRGIKVRNATVSFDLAGTNKDCIALALTHTGQPAQFDDIDVDVRPLNTPGNYYAMSTSLPEANVRYQLQDHNGTGRINTPAWQKKGITRQSAIVMPDPINPKLRANRA